jgi:hypothetical protein
MENETNTALENLIAEGKVKAPEIEKPKVKSEVKTKPK